MGGEKTQLLSPTDQDTGTRVFRNGHYGRNASIPERHILPHSSSRSRKHTKAKKYALTGTLDGEYVTSTFNIIRIYVVIFFFNVLNSQISLVFSYLCL